MYTYTYISIYLSIYMNISIYIHMYTYIHINIYKCKYISLPCCPRRRQGLGSCGPRRARDTPLLAPPLLVGFVRSCIYHLLVHLSFIHVFIIHPCIYHFYAFIDYACIYLLFMYRCIDLCIYIFYKELFIRTCVFIYPLGVVG